MALSSLLIRCLSMLFRIYLSEQIGAEGLGIYQLILTVYAFFALIATTGISIAVTRLCADHFAKDEPGKAMYILRQFLIIGTLLGAVLGLVLFCCAEVAGAIFLKDVRTIPALKLLAPSLPFMAFSAALRGYYTAKRKTLPTVGEQLLEQLTEIGICTAAFTIFSERSMEAACCAAVAGTTAAEILSFVYSLVLYRIEKKRCQQAPAQVDGLLRAAIPIALPCTASAALRSGLSAIENMLIPTGLMRFGAGASEALAEYGIITGMALPVIVFPGVFILPFASLIVTELSQAAALHHQNEVRHITEKMLTAAIGYSLPVMGVLIFGSRLIGELVFHSESAGFYIAALAPLAPMMFLDSVIDGMLKGLNRQTSYFLFNVTDSMIRVLLTMWLLPIMGTAGVIFIMLFSELFNTTLSLWELIRTTQLKFPLWKLLLFPLCLVVIPLIYHL